MVYFRKNVLESLNLPLERFDNCWQSLQFVSMKDHFASSAARIVPFWDGLSKFYKRALKYFFFRHLKLFGAKHHVFILPFNACFESQVRLYSWQDSKPHYYYEKTVKHLNMDRAFLLQTHILFETWTEISKNAEFTFSDFIFNQFWNL